MVSIFASGPFCKNKIISSCFYFFRYINDHLHRLFNIFPVNQKCLHTWKYLLQKRYISNFLLCNYWKRYRADLHYGKHVIQSLVIRIKHKPILRRYIFYSMAVYMKISSTISCMVNFFQHGIALFLCVFIHMRSIPVQHDPIIWYEYNILQYHYNDSFHFQAPFLYAKLPSAIKIFFGSISNHDMKKGHCKIQSSCSSLPSTLHPAYLQFSPHTPGSFW